MWMWNPNKAWQAWNYNIAPAIRFLFFVPTLQDKPGKHAIASTLQGKWNNHSELQFLYRGGSTGIKLSKLLLLANSCLSLTNSMKLMKNSNKCWFSDDIWMAVFSFIESLECNRVERPEAQYRYRFETISINLTGTCTTQATKARRQITNRVIESSAAKWWWHNEKTWQFSKYLKIHSRESVLSLFVANLCSTRNFQSKIPIGESQQSRGSFPDQNFTSIDPDSMFQKSTICNYCNYCDYDDCCDWDDYDDCCDYGDCCDCVRRLVRLLTIVPSILPLVASTGFRILTSRLTHPFCETSTLTWQLVPVSSLTLLLFDGWPLTTKSLEPVKHIYPQPWLLCPTAPSHPCCGWNHSSHTYPSLAGRGHTVKKCSKKIGFKHLKNSPHTQLWWKVLIRPISHEKNCTFWSRLEIWRRWNSNGWKGSCQRMLNFGPSNQFVSWTRLHSMAQYTQSIDSSIGKIPLLNNLLTLLAMIFQICAYSGWPGFICSLQGWSKWFSIIWTIWEKSILQSNPWGSPRPTTITSITITHGATAMVALSPKLDHFTDLTPLFMSCGNCWNSSEHQINPIKL